MLTLQHLADLVKKARNSKIERGFSQSVELILTFRDIDVKKQEVIFNDTVFLPHRFTQQPTVCIFASGDLAVRARKANADTVIEPEELDTLASDKREAKKISRRFNFFLAETTLMARIGKILGSQLGPKGKMPTPMPPSASVEDLIERYRMATKVRSRNQMSISCKVGDESMSDEQIAANALAVFGAVEKKLPSGEKNVKNATIKLTMSSPVILSMRGV